MTNWEELQKHKAELSHLATFHGAVNLRVLGSFANDQASEVGDLDLLIDLGPNRTPFFPGGLVSDLEDLLHRRVLIVTPNSLHWSIREQVLQEARPL